PGRALTGVWNVTIVITSVAFCGALSVNFKRKVFSVDSSSRSRTATRVWPVADAWDSLTGGCGGSGGGVVRGVGGEREAVSKVGLTAADLAAAQRRESAALTRIYTAYAPALF